jgi:hypothetical protein
VCLYVFVCVYVRVIVCVFVWLCVCACARMFFEREDELGLTIIHNLDGVKPGSLQKSYILSPPEVQCFSLLPRLYFFIYFCAVSRSQSVKVSVSKLLKAVHGMCVSVADCTGSTSAACKPATNSSKR